MQIFNKEGNPLPLGIEDPQLQYLRLHKCENKTCGAWYFSRNTNYCCEPCKKAEKERRVRQRRKNHNQWVRFQRTGRW